MGVDGERGHSGNRCPVAAAEPADGAAGRFSDGYRKRALAGRRGPAPPDITAAPGARLAAGININGFPR
jgi:hypothetical protein